MLLTNEDRRFIIKYYPWLIIQSEELIEWFLSFKGFYNEKNNILISNEIWRNYLEYNYKIKIKLHKHKFPEVFELSWDLKRWIDFHIYSDWRFCLTHTLYEKKYKNKNFQFILEQLIIPFLYNQTFNIKNWHFLWEYWHEFEWDFEFIFDNKVSKNDNMEILKKIIPLIWRNKKLLLYSENERERLIKLLKLNSNKSIKWFYKFIEYLKRNTNLFTKI